MFQILRDVKRILIIFIFFTMIFCFACDNKQKYTGLYRAEGGELQREHVNTIELKESSQGIWRIANDEASFSWGINGKEIRLHTKTGGIIKGMIKNNGIEIMLPNSQTVFFTKIK
jgi:hypothetical protein